MIELTEIRKSFPIASGQLDVLKGITLTIAQGDFLALTGPSGSGKSTLLALIGLLDRPSGGRYEFRGRDVSEMSDAQESRFRSESIGFIFQSFHLIPVLSILENVEVPLFYAGVPRRDRRAQAVRALESVGLGDRLRHRPPQLSGGEQQRAAIARAIVRDPPFLVADEPTGNLDTQTGERIMEIFHGLHAEGKTVLLVTHDRDLAAQTPREVRMLDGLICEDVGHTGAGPPPQ